MSYIPDRKIMELSRQINEAREKFEKVAAERDALRDDLAAARAMLDDDGPDGRKVTNAQHVALRQDLAAAREPMTNERIQTTWHVVSTRPDFGGDGFAVAFARAIERHHLIGCYRQDELDAADKRSDERYAKLNIDAALAAKDAP
jgi:hypothetical protein